MSNLALPALDRSAALVQGSTYADDRSTLRSRSRTAAITIVLLGDDGPMTRRLLHKLRGHRLEVSNVWDDPDSVVRHRVLSLPTLLIMVDGVERERMVGPFQCRRLDRLVARLVAEAPAAHH